MHFISHLNVCFQLDAYEGGSRAKENVLVGDFFSSSGDDSTPLRLRLPEVVR